jgi:diaminobutyrate-2-oxoglutarate transaminase
VLSLGHNHPDLVRAVTDQLGLLTHGLDFPTPIKDAFVEAQLSMLSPGLRDRMKVHFCGPTGANAVDAAVRLCKTATGRGDLVSFQGGFHGSSHAAMALTGLLEQKRPVPNGMPGVHFFPYSYCSRCPMDLTPDSCDTNCVGYLERSLRDSNAGVPLPGAVILELVQGEGGVVPARADFVRRLRALTRELDIPLIVDEVQTGCGRTGRARARTPEPFAAISWHSPRARPAVQVIRRDDVLGNVGRRGEQVADRLTELAHTTPSEAL